jgi:hypothetical protein
MFTHSYALALVLALVSIAGAEMVANPEYQSWSRFKPGTVTKMETRSVSNGREIRSEITNKLLEVTPQKLVIETTTVLDASGQKMQSPTVTRDVPAEMDEALVARSDPARNPDIKQSEETRSVNGKDYVCKVLTHTTENNGMKSVSRTWHSPDVPGGIVGSHVKISGTIDSTTEMNLVELSVGE